MQSHVGTLPKSDGISSHPAAKIELRIRFYRGSTGELNRASFSISKREIETQAGLTLIEGDAYKLKGNVENLWKFDLDRTITRDRYLDIYVPTKFQRSFERDKEYQVAIDSIQLLNKGVKQLNAQDDPIATRLRVQNSLSSPHMLKAQARPGGKTISFALTKSWIEKDTKVIFETGRAYMIQGSLGNICSFSSLLRETGYSEVHHVYVPSESVANFHPGEKYEVRIEKVEETQIINETPSRRVDDFWDWKTVAAWADTEGQYQSERSPFRAVISQDDREPLEEIHAFLLGESIPSVVYDMGNGHYQLRTLGGMESLAKFILKTEPYTRTQNKREQIAHFKEIMKTRKKYENVHKRNARRILGL